MQSCRECFETFAHAHKRQLRRSNIIGATKTRYARSGEYLLAKINGVHISTWYACRQPILWCSLSSTTKTQPHPSPCATEDGLSEKTARACASTRHEADLWKHNPLKVSFLKKSKDGERRSTLLAKWDLDEETILAWAKRWSQGDESGTIPSFELCRREREADIVVELNGE